MSYSCSWFEISKYYEQVKIMDDMNDLGSWTKYYIYPTNISSCGWLIHAQLVYALLIGVQSAGVLWFQSSGESNQQNL